MFNKFLSKVGIGAAKVDTVLKNPELVRGEVLEGEIRLTGGKGDTEINKLYLELFTYYEYEYEVEYEDEEEERTSTRSYVLHRLDIDDSFTLEAGAEEIYDFTLQVPLITPISFGKAKTTLKTGLDVSWAWDPKDHDVVTVLPDPASAMILEAAEDLGFVHSSSSGKCFEMHTPQGAPFVQEFEFKGKGPLGSRIEELELLIMAYDDEIEVMMEIDRRGRGVGGWFAEQFDLNEHHLRISLPHDAEFGPADLEGILLEALG